MLKEACSDGMPTGVTRPPDSAAETEGERKKPRELCTRRSAGSALGNSLTAMQMTAFEPGRWGGGLEGLGDCLARR